MTKWDFLFYNFIGVVDIILIYTIVLAFKFARMEQLTKMVSVAIAIIIEKFYSAKETYIRKLSKDEKEFLEKTGQNSSSFNN